MELALVDDDGVSGREDPVGAEADPALTVTRQQVHQLGANLLRKFDTFKTDRKPLEQKYLANLRQFLGVYDPDVEKMLSANRSRAYPRLTRVKLISTLSRIMNLMFPGNEKNWTITASPSAEMDPQDVLEFIRSLSNKMQAESGQAPVVDERFVQEAAQRLAEERAAELSLAIEDQLAELGGDQTMDYVTISREVAKSGLLYGVGIVRGPYARPVQRTVWRLQAPTDELTGEPTGAPAPTPVSETVYKPMVENLSVWDYYGDMSAKAWWKQDGYFYRLVMTKPQVSRLKTQKGFFPLVIDEFMSVNSTGNWKEDTWETQLRSIGSAQNIQTNRVDADKYEIIVWNGPVSVQQLTQAGNTIPEGVGDNDFLQAEVWLLGDHVIKAQIDPWTELGANVRMLHIFEFEHDDTSPIGNALPNVIRDSQMAIANAARMLLDNASVVCGPITEVNIDLLEGDQDVSAIQAYDTIERGGTGQDALAPAIRPLEIKGYLAELQGVMDLFMRVMDMESFVGPATGGDMDAMPSEGMRTIAGASMIQSDAALPFKDIIRNFDVFVSSLIQSLVQFNKKLNPHIKPGDYNVVARGATSLIAKEVRGVQIDSLTTLLTPEERVHIDERRMVEAKLAVRDLTDMLVSPEEAKRRQQANAQVMEEQRQLSTETARAQIREILSKAHKNLTQSAKNTANAETETINAMLALLEAAIQGDQPQEQERVAA